MDYRDPAPEFESVPQDYGPNPEEFSEAPEIESTVSEEEKEYEYQSSAETPKKRTGKMKRALLIQAAGIMVGAVVILDSFGVDHLGFDGLFNDEEHWEEYTEYDDPWQTEEPWTEEPHTDEPERTVDNWPARDSKWPTRVNVRAHVTYLPSGETADFEFQTNETFSYDEGMRDAKLWVQELGGDPNSLRLVEATNNPVDGIQLSEDAIVAGSGDSVERMELLHGEAWWECDREEWYEADIEAEDDAFPDLPNRDPDYEGKYAWSVFYGFGGGPEEYVNLDGVALHAGSGIKEDPVYSGSTTGAYYDMMTNTLTLENYHGGQLETNLMGNGFKIRLIGENSLDAVRIWGAVYGGSVTFTGDGSLRINEHYEPGDFSTGLMMNCEGAPSALMVDSGVTLEIFGDQAVVIHLTRLGKAIYTKRDVTVTGGVPSQGAFVEYTITNNLGESMVWTVKEIAANNGMIGEQQLDGWVAVLQNDLGEGVPMELYDYAIVGSDGRPATHVLFAPR